MTIQWFTIVAQIVNFLVLVYLLQRFLYGPIVAAMDERQTKIAQRMQDAEETRRQAEEEATAYRRKTSELEETRDQLMVEMRQEVDERRATLLQEVRDAAKEREQQWRQSLQRDQEDFLRELRRETSRHIYAIAERALQDVSDVALNTQTVDAFLRHIEQLDEAAWRDFEQILHDNAQADAQPIVIQSAYELSEESRRRIGEMLQIDGQASVDLRFEIDPDLIAGIKLQGQNHIAAWNLAEYLDELAARTYDLLEQEARDDPVDQATKRQSDEQADEDEDDGQDEGQNELSATIQAT